MHLIDEIHRCTVIKCKENEYAWWKELFEGYHCLVCPEECIYGCYADDRCKKVPLTTSVKQLPNTPLSYALTLSRPIEKYDNYSKIFHIMIIDDDHFYHGKEDSLDEGSYKVYFDKLSVNHTEDVVKGNHTNMTFDELKEVFHLDFSFRHSIWHQKMVIIFTENEDLGEVAN